MQKLTVTNLFSFTEPTILIKIEELIGTFITQNYLLLATYDKILRYQLKQFKFIDSLNISSIFNQQKLQENTKIKRHVLGISEVNHIIFVIFKNSCIVTILDGRGRQIKKLGQLKGHIQPLTSTCLIPGMLVTGSKDFTIRLWDIAAHSNIKQQNAVKNTTNKLLNCKQTVFGLTGHKDVVSCLAKYLTLFASGSLDKRVILWNKKLKIAQKQFQSQIAKIQACQQSQQMAVCEKNGTISILQIGHIYSSVYHGNTIPQLNVIRTLNSQVASIVSIKEIDQSFVVYSDGQSINFFQINLGKILRKVEIDSVVDIQSLGKVLIIGRHYSGVHLLKL